MKALIFGTGIDAKRIYFEAIEEFEIIGFLDNAIAKQHQQNEINSELVIYSPNELEKIIYDKVILGSTKYAVEMFTQLLGLGVREHNIISKYVCKKNRIAAEDLYRMQSNDMGKNLRMDIAVKYLFVESFRRGELNDLSRIKNFYIEMQCKRLNINRVEAEQLCNQFIKLIKSIEENGYREDMPITCDLNLKIMDGAHRLACALAYGIDMVMVNSVPQPYYCDYRVEWFWENGFNREQINVIKEVNDEILSRRKELIAFIWPPAMEYVEEIKDDIAEWCTVKESYTIKFENDIDFINFVNRVYACDDIDYWKIEKKIQSMQECKKNVEILILELTFLEYRVKNVTGLPLSKKVEEIKKIIRSRYKDRINNYFFDNILHITDSCYQTLISKKILSLNYNLNGYFNRINHLQYVLIKVDVPYMPKDFPYNYAIHKDLDILVTEKDFESLTYETNRFVEEYAKKYDLNVRIIQSNLGKKCRIEYLGFLIFQFDIRIRTESIKEERVVEIINKREYINNYYTTRYEDEIFIRKEEIRLFPKKLHHKEYIKEKF